MTEKANTTGPIITISMTPEAIDIVLAGLAKLPLETSNNLYHGISNEKQKQMERYAEKNAEAQVVGMEAQPGESYEGPSTKDGSPE